MIGMTEKNMTTDEKIQPVEEMVAYEEFTDRVEILRELDGWVKNVQRMAAPSTAIIAPRRMGKTVLLDRLVNTVFFKPEYGVAPFIFALNGKKPRCGNFSCCTPPRFFGNTSRIAIRIRYFIRTGMCN